MDISSYKGVEIKIKKDFQSTIFDFMNGILESGEFDAILCPVKVPAGDSYSWILCKDTSLLEDASPVAPVMPVQGAKALKSLTRKSHGELKVAVNQVSLENILLISYDCPGAIPYQDFLKKPQAFESKFNDILSKADFNSDMIKPVCQMCTEFSVSAADLHFSFLNQSKESALLISGSQKGQDLLESQDLQYTDDFKHWQNEVLQIRGKREKKRTKIFDEIRPQIDGIQNLEEIFGNCIGCHNCQNACPICYCRQCYFDSEVAQTAKQITQSDSDKNSSILFPQDRVMFHVGRMTHMSLSCVSCGQCTDVCPVNIPVAKIFSYVADSTQKTFDYIAGHSEGEALPLKDFKLTEIANIDELVKSAESEETPHE